MLDKDTKQRINSARQILVGKVPDPKAQVEQITNALIYKFMDDMDRENEELGGKAQFLTDDLKEFSWGRLMSRELSGLERWDLYTRALSSFAKSEQIPELFRTIFKDAYLPYRDPETLTLFLKEINGFSYSNSENLGNAFEYLLSILGSQGDAGQFRTPRHIIDFIVEVVNPQKTDRILDPACGTAGFLISSYKHIWRENSSNYKADEYTPTFAESESTDIASVEIQKNGKFRGDKLGPDDRKRLAENIVGYDISPDMVRLSLVNLYLHGFSTPRVYEYDTLTYEERWQDNFDIILANPPFMTPKGGIRPHKLFQVSANRAEVLFVDYIAEHLTIHGKAGIIVPEGIIFQSANAYKALRKMLVEEHYLYAVVSLPAGVFQPYSGVKTSILFLDKTLAKRSDEILFVKVENDGFDLGAQRRRIEKNDLPLAFDILQGWQRGEKRESKFALWVKKEKIADNGDYNLTGDRYREAVDYSKVKWPMVRLGDVAEVISGQSPPGKYYNEKGEGVPFYQGKTEFKERVIGKPKKWTTHTTKIAIPGDILMSVRAPVGPVNFTRQKICIGRGLAAIRCNQKKIEPNYLFFLLKDKESEIQGNKGAAFSSINRKDIQQIQIPLPPLEVQKEIVAELDSYQKVIDGARQVAENWKPRIKINPDWPMVKLGEVCKINPRKSEIKALPENTNVSFVPMECIKEHRIDFSPKENRNLSDVYKGYTYFKDHDVVLAKVTPCFENGKSGIANNLTNSIGFGSSEFIVLRANTDILPQWIYYFVSSNKFIEEGRNNMSGTGGLRRLTKYFVENYSIPLPPLGTQKEIVAEIEKEQKMVEECKKLIAIHEQKIKDKIAEVWGEV
jgi:type I restriction enzyme M protein